MNLVPTNYQKKGKNRLGPVETGHRANFVLALWHHHLVTLQRNGRDTQLGFALSRLLLLGQRAVQ